MSDPRDAYYRDELYRYGIPEPGEEEEEPQGDEDEYCPDDDEAFWNWVESHMGED
jgi:hypothetical protein